MDSTESAILEALGRATDYYDVSLKENNEKAYKYYNGDLPGTIDADVTEYFQQIVSPDVANVVDHTLADIMPAFAATSPVAFIPNGPEDEIQASVETQAVNNVFFQQSDGFVQLLTAAQDAMLNRIGVIEIQTNEKVEVEYMELENVTIDILTQYLQDPNVEINKINGELLENAREEILDSELTVELKRTSKKKELYIDAFPPGELRVLPDCEEVNLDNASFVARERMLRRSELVELGYDPEIVKGLPTYGTDNSIRPYKQRKDDIGSDRTATHESNDHIHVAFIYMRIDADEDGIAELRKVVAAGNLPSGATILENVPCNYQPFAIGVPYLYAHRVAGVSLYDKIKQVQDIKTKVTRQLLTAGERAVRGRLGVVGQQANIKDVQETMFGGIIRLTTPNGVVPIPTDRYPSEVADLLVQADQRRKESGGSAVDKASEEILVGGDTAHGLERIMSAMEQLNSLVAKLLAETLLRQVYRKIHYNLRQHFSGDMSIQVENNWKSTTPQNWPPREYVVAALGLTMGDRMRQAASYDKLIIDHKELLQQGSTVVNERTMYQLLVARANSLVLPSAYTFYVDPQSQKGQQAAQQKQEAQQAAAQREEQMTLSQYQLMLQIEGIKAQSAASVQEMRNQIKTLELQLERTADNNELTYKYDELKLQLAELNAKYDAEKVPDVV